MVLRPPIDQPRTSPHWLGSPEPATARAVAVMVERILQQVALSERRTRFRTP